MQSSNAPSKIVLPFAENGNKNIIPVDSQIGITAGAASLEDGFPPLTMTPVAAGGVPPSGLDMNGILNEVSAIVRWANAGGGYAYDSDFATDANVGGYPKGARVMRSDGTGYWFNTAENNVTDPESAGAAAAGWVPDYQSGATAISMSGSSVTLTELQYGKRVIVLSGVITASLNVIFPSIVSEWVIINNTTGDFNLYAKTAGGIPVKIHDVTSIVCDGTNVKNSIGETQDSSAVMASLPENASSIAGTPIFIAGTGQSNMVGANSGGPNPASDLVKTWNGSTGLWGGSDYTAAPWSLAAPDGNGGNNNLLLAFAHRLAHETQRPVYIVFDALGGRPISDWVGTSSVRYAALKAKIEAAIASPELVAAGITKLDALLWMQGEEDYLQTFDYYLNALNTVVDQFKAESWFGNQRPFIMGEMSDLHDRYEPKKAIRFIGSGSDPWCNSVNSKGLLTPVDATHFGGDDLWEFGYYRFYNAFLNTPRTGYVPQNIWRNRDALSTSMPGSDPAYEDVVVYSSASISGGGASRAPNFSGTVAYGPSVSQGASNGISVGSSLTVTGGGCATFGVGSTVSDIDCLVGGFTHTVAGRYSVATGYQNTINSAAQYSGAFGRGHTLADPYTYAVGGFTEYTTTLADPAVFQVGVAVSAGSPKNGLTIFRSGLALFNGNIDFKTDNAFSLGTASHRSSVVYSATAAINTSDARLKTVRGALSDAELRAWAKVQPCIYQFIDSIEEKGEEFARLHSGFIAQEVMAAFESEGLNPERYALFCKDEVFHEESVIETIQEKQQRTEKKTIYEIDIIDGNPIYVARSIDVPVFEDVPVLDEDGGNVFIDAEGNRIESGNQLMFKKPVFDIVEKQETKQIKISDGYRYGLRYTECLVFELAYIRSRLDKAGI